MTRFLPVVCALLTACTQPPGVTSDELAAALAERDARIDALEREVARLSATPVPAEPVPAEPAPSGEGPCTVTLTSYGDHKIAVIREVRTLTGLGLAETKTLVESAPTVIMKGVERDDIDRITASIKGAGGGLSASCSP